MVSYEEAYSHAEQTRVEIFPELVMYEVRETDEMWVFQLGWNQPGDYDAIPPCVVVDRNSGDIRVDNIMNPRWDIHYDTLPLYKEFV